MITRKKRHLRKSIKVMLIIILCLFGVSSVFILVEKVVKPALGLDKESIKKREEEAQKQKEEAEKKLKLTLLAKEREQKLATIVQKYPAKVVVIYDLEAEKTIYEFNSSLKVAPASLTKLFTIYYALQKIKDLEAIAPIDSATYLELVDKNASMAGFYGEEQTTYRDLLYGTMLASGGECASSLAINIAGSVDSYVEEINNFIKKDNFIATNFKNVEGLDSDNHYSCGKDIIKLLSTALKNSFFRTLFTTEIYHSSSTEMHPEGLDIKSTVLANLNDYEQEGFRILGGKSGTTGEAGLCWATLASKNQKEYLILVMGIPFTDLLDTGDMQILETLDLLKAL